MPTIVIAGGGVAAERCAFELRRLGFAGRVVIVAREPVAPYDRTLVSKDLLRPSPPLERAALHAPDDYEREGIELWTGAEATRLDTAGRRLELADGRTLGWDRLVICTGGEPVLPRALTASGVHVLRDLRHAEALRAQLGAGRHVAVVGGGFIGGEVASTAIAHGARVTLVEALEQPLARVVGTEAGARVADLHRRAGVDVQTGVAVTTVDRRNGGYRVALADGRAVCADTVVVGAGMRPATAWLEGSGVELDGGVVTDAACRTTVPGVLAAGDCARWHNPRYGEAMRVEHWDTARRHGAAVAASALGEDRPFDPLPFFWSDQHGTKLQWVGHAPRWDAVEVEDEAPGRFSARYLLGGRLVAAFAAGRAKAIAAARKELNAKEAS